MSWEEEFEHNLRSLADARQQARRRGDICIKAHKMIVDGDYNLRELLDLLASSWKVRDKGIRPDLVDTGFAEPRVTEND